MNTITLIPQGSVANATLSHFPFAIAMVDVENLNFTSGGADVVSDAVLARIHEIEDEVISKYLSEIGTHDTNDTHDIRHSRHVQFYAPPDAHVMCLKGACIYKLYPKDIIATSGTLQLIARQCNVWGNDGKHGLRWDVDRLYTTDA
jgi:hypothetical protein